MHLRSFFALGLGVCLATLAAGADSIKPSQVRHTSSEAGPAGSDPTNDVVFIGIIQRWAIPNLPDVENLSRALTYQALVDPTE